jgi:hypothetical protein
MPVWLVSYLMEKPCYMWGWAVLLALCHLGCIPWTRSPP